LISDLAGTPVSAEHRGLARAFRNKVMRVDKAMDAALAAIIAPLRTRLQRHPKLRREQVAISEALYRKTIPSAFRFGTIEVMKDRTEFAISEIRLSGSWITCDQWDGPEQREHGVSVCRFVFSMHDGSLRERWQPLVSISLHALARRIGRGAGRER
jgi:hypothetical protein